ncbi:site-specific integrase [Sphingomonas cynarae]|uniref:site-specific integrase n=1 Tax=Sphingomonas cynarae TaxID=930197 RepID=UPI0031DFC5DC
MAPPQHTSDDHITGDVPPSRSLVVVAPVPALRSQPSLPGLVQAETERADAYARAARAENTHRGYRADWTIFTAWCAGRGESALPAGADVVRRFIGAEADRGRSPATIERRLAAIGHYHRLGGFVAPTDSPDAGPLRETMAGIRRARGGAVVRKQAADAAILERLLATITGDGVRARRDRAVLVIGMAAALRRSELVALTMADVALVPEGLRLTIRGSKTDQAGRGVVIAIPEGMRLAPKARLMAWLAAAGHDEGPLFRRLTRGDEPMAVAMSDRAVARLVQGAAVRAGLDPRRFAGHSLRAGFLTESAARGATIFKMQEVSRHKTVQILADYVRNAELFKDHAGAGFL